MRPNPRWIVGLVAVLAVMAVSAASREDDNKQDRAPSANPELDRAIYDSLRDVINTGAAVYNKNDHPGCYRIFHGALLAVKPILAYRPELQKTIDAAISAAEGDPLVWRRAFTLRAALDKIRSEVKGKQEDKKDDKAKDVAEMKDKPKDSSADKDKPKKDDKKSEKDKDDKDKTEKKDQEKKDDKDKENEQSRAKVEQLPPPMTEEVER